MTRAVKLIAMLFILSLMGSAAAFAADPGVEKQILQMKQQMEQMQKKMMDLQSQLDTAQQDATSAARQAQQAAAQVDQKVAEVSGKFKVLDDLAKKFSHLKINGYVRSRWWEGDHQQNSFDVTEIALQMRYDVSENISGEFHIWYHPSGNSGVAEYANWAGPTTFFESAFAEFRNLNIGPVEGKLIVGKTRNQAFGIVPAGGPNGRVTSDYSLFHQINNISRITGIQYLTKWQNWRWNFAAFNGYALARGTYGARPAGIRQLGCGQLNLDDNNNKAYSTRLGYVFPKQKFIDKLDIGVTYFTQKLSDNDLNTFNTVMGRNAGMQGNFWGDPSRSRSDRRFGGDLSWDYGPYAVKAEYVRASISDVIAESWYGMVGYKLKPLKMEFWLRYSQATYDQTTIRDINASGAWDKAQWTPLIIYHLHPRASLYFEYYFNRVNRPSGADNISDNNYGFVELIVKY